MAGRRKRRIRVDGVDYLWVVAGAGPGHVVVRIWWAGSGRGRPLEVRVPFGDGWLRLGSTADEPGEPAPTPVRPGLVERLVRAGLARGWYPDATDPVRLALDRSHRLLVPPSAAD
ncbi:hypothetical protein [Plantactinospora sp. KLBMP9567]|uniref:hypothetical protein n=1 Tax=Plantactinospora sp. KLBMP9567 TaxID=3085900 RepID=UPI0029817CF6|nr:hypothetical protein [Plantactinospora sp. KLBMP9567]MDW5326028.1 hypothetical protein [Plantactinospora sp. KLBMP9567]